MQINKLGEKTMRKSSLLALALPEFMIEIELEAHRPR